MIDKVIIEKVTSLIEKKEACIDALNNVKRLAVIHGGEMYNKRFFDELQTEAKCWVCAKSKWTGSANSYVEINFDADTLLYVQKENVLYDDNKRINAKAFCGACDKEISKLSTSIEALKSWIVEDGKQLDDAFDKICVSIKSLQAVFDTIPLELKTILNSYGCPRDERIWDVLGRGLTM